MEELFYFENDGFRLAASLHLPEASVEGGAPAVVIFHGLTGHRIGPKSMRHRARSREPVLGILHVLCRNEKDRRRSELL